MLQVKNQKLLLFFQEMAQGMRYILQENIQKRFSKSVNFNFTHLRLVLWSNKSIQWILKVNQLTRF